VEGVERDVIVVSEKGNVDDAGPRRTHLVSWMGSLLVSVHRKGQMYSELCSSSDVLD
jgi:hypothetical protein